MGISTRMNKTRAILLVYPVFAAFSLWFTNAMFSEHGGQWRLKLRDFESLALMAGAFWVVLWVLLRGARRDRSLDCLLAIVGLCVYVLPWAGIVFATGFGLWLSWDLRRV